MEPTGYTIFCDDIRSEVGGKISLIGCYSGVMLVSGHFPIIIPKFGLSITCISAMEKLRQFEIKVFLPLDPDDKPSIAENIALPPDGVDAFEPFVPDSDPDVLRLAFVTRNFILSPLEIRAEGNIKVRIVHNERLVKAGALRVLLAPSAEQLNPTKM
ncbi:MULTISPECIES: hypothetical protein [unclassified Methylosinus]|jgi:hypothetical protein|uniref:DUF6941 family protein n=1 Tax=unclassified Methylosinus TaxID=2624500 RepID=UPI0010656614|nr:MULTISPECIES: hypothetical protein [unclassified Methylosinus]